MNMYKIYSHLTLNWQKIMYTKVKEHVLVDSDFLLVIIHRIMICTISRTTVSKQRIEHKTISHQGVK